MNFKTYDILSSLVPGFLLLVAIEGNIEVKIDKELIEAYGKGNDNDDDESNKNAAQNIYIGSQTSRLDNKPMGK